MSKQGLFALRLKLPAGYSVPPHTHPVDEVVIGPRGLTYVNPEDDPPPKSQ